MPTPAREGEVDDTSLSLLAAVGPLRAWGREVGRRTTMTKEKGGQREAGRKTREREWREGWGSSRGQQVVVVVVVVWVVTAQRHSKQKEIVSWLI